MQFVDFHPKLKLAYTEIDDGNLDYRYTTKTDVKDNRKEVFNKFGIKPYEVIEAAQIHGNRILTLNKENTKMWRGHNVTGVDGFTINQNDTALMLRLADCVPLILYDPDHHAFGIFHVGWRSAVKEIHLLGLERMVQKYKTEPKSVLAWLGPSAQSCCYVSAEKPEQVSEPMWKSHIKKKQGQWSIDIPGYLFDTLNQAGIYKKNIQSSKICTVESNQLFSHQKALKESLPESRFAVLAKLK